MLVLITMSSQAAAVGTSLVDMPHSPGTMSPFPNIGGISERCRERTKAARERYVAAEAIVRLVEKLLMKTRLKAGQGHYRGNSLQ